MSKKTKIIFGSLILIYVLALIVFHATYSYTFYWIEESTIIIPASIIYFIFVIIIYKVFHKNATMTLNTNIGVKEATKIVAYASAFKAVLCICPYLYYYEYTYILMHMQFTHLICWIAITVFFFTLYKNMQ